MAKILVDNQSGNRNFGAIRGKKRRMVGRLAYLLGVALLIGYSIELTGQAISTFELAWRFSIGLILLGIGLRIWTRISSGPSRDRFVDLTWSTSLGIAVSIIGLVVIGVSTAGNGLTPSTVVTAITVGAFLGFAFGVISFQPDASGQSAWTFTQLVWFAAGLGVSALIMALAGKAVFLLKNFSTAITALEIEPSMAQLLTGVAVVLTGWIISWFSARHKMPRGLVAGVFIGATLLGASCVFAF